jgi:predicted kinase
MAKITVLIGISGSGKSTFANELSKKTGAVIVSRDGIRSMLFGLSDEEHVSYYQREDLFKCEKAVTEVEKSTIKSLLRSGKDVIADNTHLRLKYVQAYRDYGVRVEYKLIDEDLFTCLTWDSQRKKSVGEEVIKRQYSSLLELKKTFDFSDYEPVSAPLKVRDENKQDCYIFDLDGTLALMKDRSPFDWHRVDEDLLNTPVYEIYQALSISGVMMKMNFLIVTGRSEEAYEPTIRWLKKYAIDFDGLYMRSKGDNRKDSIVKEEIWQEIEKDYNIICMFDDRDQVVNHARSLGYAVLQVAEGNF